MTSIFLAASLVKAFSGKGLVPDELVSEPSFLLSVGIGAAATVFLATKLGIPISTTHSLTGALVGAGLSAAIAANGIEGIRGAISFTVLRENFFIPLLASPIVSIFIACTLYRILNKTRIALGIEKETCVCIGEEAVLRPCHATVSTSIQTVSTGSAVPTIRIAASCVCDEQYVGRIVGIDAQEVLNRFHFLSAGAVSFARGLNDTPKIVSLLIAAKLLNVPFGLTLIGFGIALGGWISARSGGNDEP